MSEKRILKTLSNWTWITVPVSLVDAGGPALLFEAPVRNGPLHPHVFQVLLHAVSLGALARREALVHFDKLDWITTALLGNLLQSGLVETVGHFIPVQLVCVYKNSCQSISVS